ncbi:hypothetical protein SAMN05443579_102154 [Variovorax sp. PDC80]|nr:hypothetical protein SAMN05443579_102154 [Variovorax sp. PDC80]
MPGTAALPAGFRKNPDRSSVRQQTDSRWPPISGARWKASWSSGSMPCTPLRKQPRSTVLRMRRRCTKSSPSGRGYEGMSGWSSFIITTPRPRPTSSSTDILDSPSFSIGSDRLAQVQAPLVALNQPHRFKLSGDHKMKFRIQEVELQEADARQPTAHIRHHLLICFFWGDVSDADPAIQFVHLPAGHVGLCKCTDRVAIAPRDEIGEIYRGHRSSVQCIRPCRSRQTPEGVPVLEGTQRASSHRLAGVQHEANSRGSSRAERRRDRN